MKISACYITKDEAANLPRSLASIAGAYDELVVVDTGSQDATQEIARSAGARLLFVPWQDDFSMPRNAAIEHATGDWILFLDADESLTEDTRGHVRDVVNAAGDADVILMLREDVDAAGEIQKTLYVPRLFRRRPGLRYEGAIHEELRDDDEPVAKVYWAKAEELRLHHTGYAGPLAQEKAERNLRLLLRERVTSSHPERLDAYLAETYYGLGDKAQAMTFARRDIARGRQPLTYASRAHRILLACLADGRRPEERLAAAQQAVKAFPELPEFHAELAEAWAGVCAFSAAVEEAGQAIELAGQPHGIEPSDFGAVGVEQVQRRRALWQRVLYAAEHIDITACCIVRDEEARMTAWAENAEGYSDRRIVVDTGSKDATVERAVSAGCQVFSFAWQEDFAAAKNEALRHAPGDGWVTFLDADETFFHPERVRPFLAWLETTYPESEAVEVTIVNVDEDDENREMQRFPAIRLFRHQEDIDYQGRVHETLEKQGGKLAIWQTPGLAIRHTGYSKSRMAAKSARNAAILATLPEDDPRVLHYRGSTAFAEGRYEEAERYGLQAILSPWQATGSRGDLYWMVLDCMRLRGEPWEERLAMARRAAEAVPQLPDFPARIGIALTERGAWAEAAPWLDRAETLLAAGGAEGREASHFASIRAELLAARALCRCQLTETAGADGTDGKTGKENVMQELEEALAEAPQDENVLAAYHDVAVKCGRSEAEIAESLLRHPPEDGGRVTFLLHWAERTGCLALYRIFAERQAEAGGTPSPRAAAYTAVEKGDWASLAANTVQAVGRDTRLLVELLLALERAGGEEQLRLQARHMLPSEAEDVWQAYEAGTLREHLDGFHALWPFVLECGDDAQIVRFAKLVAAFPDELKSCAAALQKEERWQAAFDVLSLIRAEDADGAFWQEAGICLYHLGAWDEARQCFERARQLGTETAAMRSLTAWMDEDAEKAKEAHREENA